MFFDVADIETPPLVAKRCAEGVRLRFMRLDLAWLDSVQLTILGHNAPTCPWRN